MPEMLTETDSGTKVRLDSDRQFERPAGDSVMRAVGQSPDGALVFDAAYLEVDSKESDLIAWLLRATQQPTTQTQDKIAQDVQAAFSSKLSGRDAAQIAQIVAHSWWQAAQQQLGIGDEPEARKIVSRLAERADRASAKRAEPALSGNGASQHGGSKRS